jgi:polysaccharide biosynthesis protein PslG
MRKLSILLFAAVALSAPPAAAASYAPPGFFGISPQGGDDADYALMELAGVRSVRLPMPWFAIQAENRAISGPDWSGFDHSVAIAAEHGMTIFPFVWGTPTWASREEGVLPVNTAWQRWGWSRFLNDAVRRYGPRGSFWEENPELPFMPIRRWEIWNEENIVTFADPPSPLRFARLIRLSGRVLHRADRGSKVIVGGIFGRPLQVPPNVHAGDFLSRFYRARGVKKWFDGVALHPYVADTRAIRAQIANLRRIMRVHRDDATPLYVTELGWGSDSGESRWERGLQGQARELNRSFSLFTRKRGQWRIGGVWWFSWLDADGACQFCDSAGLLTSAREAKPAWFRFNAWTGGDADTVPRLLVAPSLGY